MVATRQYTVRLRRPHAQQRAFIDSPAKRKIVKAGRRGGKTTGMGILSCQGFLAKRRVLYATPTAEQIGRFWFEVTRALAEPLEAGVYTKNETLHTIELPGTEARIRAKTAWNANTLRGDYADLLILDEWQLMDEDAWEYVGAPMLLDNNGDAVFIYTPPSLHSRSVSKARDPRHAAKMFKAAQEDTSGRWAAFHFTSYDNPYISEEALRDITFDMTALAIRQEIGAEDIDEAPGALWTRSLLDSTRVRQYPPLQRVVVGVDPPGGATEAGIVVAGLGPDQHIYIIADYSGMMTPDQWGGKAVAAFNEHQAGHILGEVNYGGDMVESTVRAAARSRGLPVRYRAVQATRGKAVRAEPIVAMFEQGRAHIVGSLPQLEDELCMWIPGIGGPSPNRLDAMVWAGTALKHPADYLAAREEAVPTMGRSPLREEF